MVVRTWWSLACACVVFSASEAHAYCRTHTEDPAESSCPQRCPERGEPLYWSTPKLVYTFNERGFPDIGDADLRRIIATSFNTWANVRCNDESVGFRVSARSATTALEVGPEKGPDREPNDNVIVHFDAAAWDDQDLPPKAFAITAVWFNPESGEIIGADMMFNGGMDPFGECPDTGCVGSSPRTDLRNVVTHEAGHFLGLSHSEIEGSTMWCDADPEETSKRSLSPDDIAGICEIYPASLSEPRSGGSCSLAQEGLRQPRWPGALLSLGAALALWLRRRRR